MLTINEQKINKLIARSTLPQKFITNLTRKKPTEPERPKYIVKPLAWSNASKMILDIFKRLNLLDETDYQKRVFTFIGYCKYRNYSLATTRKYFNEAKRLGVFGLVEEIKVIPDTLFFPKTVHNRMLSDSVFIKFIEHLYTNWSPYTAPLLTAFHTGLRSIELLQFDTKILDQLLTRKVYVDIFRKDTRQKIEQKLI